MARLREFNHCLDDCGLLDLRAEGSTWSWSNSSYTDSIITAQFDRVLVNQELINYFPDTYSQYLSAMTSYHSPLQVILKRLTQAGPRPFRYLNRWRSEEGCAEIIEQGWNLQVIGDSFYQVIGDSFYHFTQKLERVKNLLRSKRKDRSSSTVKLENMKLDLSLNRQLLQHYPTDLSLGKKEHDFREAIQKCQADRDTYLKQQSHMLWLKDGDTCLAFFYTTLWSIRKV